ncbi:MAG: DUF4912 domain-containing protein [Deltaproteobacteria bacterium]|nr:DUF4912 domain-containing protein [Deltaproteobacteria bacterium]
MDTHELSKQTKTRLLALAKRRGLKGVSRLRKAELIAKLMEATPAQPPPVSRPARAPAAPEVYASVQEATSVDAPTFHTPAEPERPGGALAAQPVNETQQDAMDSKFYLGPIDQPALAAAPELPATYDDNRLVLLARDPHWLYAYWDFSVERMSAVRTHLGGQDAQPVLRVFDVTYVDFDGTNAWRTVDIDLSPFATNWYIAVPQPDAAYCVEVGYRTVDGRFAALGRSNVVTTPRAEPSPSATLRWFTPPERQASSVPPPQGPPLPVSGFARTQGTSPVGAGALPPLPAPSSAQHPSSWSFGSKA